MRARTAPLQPGAVAVACGPVRHLVVPSVAGLLAVPAALAAQDTAAAATRFVPTLVERHCGECHSGPDAERGLDVATLFAAGRAAPPARVDAALQRLRARTMPPPDAPALGAADRQQLLLAFAGLAADEPGARVPTARRLSRLQYANSVRALFGIDWHGGERLPEDVRAHGFDTNGDVAGVAPLAFELYFAAAGDLAAAVLADTAAAARAFPSDRSLDEALRPLLERAFRRPPLPEEVDERSAMFSQLLAAGRAVTEARAAVLQSILASPAFLLRTEHGDPSAPARLSAYELADRIAFLLTSSPPDEALLAQARSGELIDPANAVTAAQRLLAADGGRAFADDFVAQWLRTRDVLTANADFRRYPQIWDHGLRPAFKEEAAQLVMAIVREDRSVLELIDADYTYVNATLAKHYGLPAVDGAAFRRVALPDRRRGGLLGTGAMLMVSSYPLRTSPVQRGRWILDVLLDASPPPPPPGVGTLPADDAPVASLSLRAQLEQHRRDKGCASCHAAMDPLGFALENYDVIGRWRGELHGQAIDAHGELPDGTGLDGPIGLKDALLQRRDEFVRAIAARMLTFAIGRPMVGADEVELAAIVAATAAGQYRFSALLAAVVRSRLFTMRDPGAP